MNRIVAVKSYGYEWTNTYGLTADEAARTLARQGVDWVVVQNLVDPLPGSAVDQTPPGPGYDDRRFRDALRTQGIRIFEATAVFFQPAALRERPDLRPIDATGAPFEQFGWYAGLCPSSPDYVAGRAAICEEVVSLFAPDGVFLSFIRFPGFWETWMPETQRAAIREYCFCTRCTTRFETETGYRLPQGDIPGRAAVLQHELRDAWTAWKCRLIAGTVASLRASAERVRPGIEMMVNCVALGRRDYDNAAMEILGQSLEAMSQASDQLELMFYHQIMKREPGAWIRSMVAEARARTPRTILACLQGKADYLDPIYAAGRRRPVIPIDEFETALGAIAASPADGVMVYHWKDFLEDEAVGGGRMSAALRAFKAGQLIRKV